jgi:hypothetical protein
MPVHPSLWLQYLILLFTIDTATVFILLLLLLFYYCQYYKTIATDKLLWASLFPGAAELTTHLLRLINILWLPLCRINNFRFYFPRRLLRSPILVGHQLAGDLLSSDDATEYHSLVGWLQYLTITHSDISYVVNRVCQFLYAPKDSHMTAVKHILRYLRHTAMFGLHLWLDPSTVLAAFSDANCAGDTLQTYL